VPFSRGFDEEMVGEIERNYAGTITGRPTRGGRKTCQLRRCGCVEEEVVESYPEDQPEQRLMAKKRLIT